MIWDDNPIRDTPYKGLMPYEEEDAPFFFGREEDWQVITDNLMVSRLTLLYGASGVGKSSILRAGVVYHLRQQAQKNIDVSGNPQFIVVFFNDWRDDPVADLLNAIQIEINRSVVDLSLEQFPINGALDEQLDAWVQGMSNDEQSAELFIILDQFEEYFLYHPQGAEADRFALEFSRAVNRSDLRANFLISMREDSIAQLDRFKGRIPHLFSNRLRLEHLDQDAARDAIVKPVEEYNRQTGTNIYVAPELVDTVLEQVKVGRVVWGDAGRGEVELANNQVEKIEAPFLQLVMTRLWQEERSQASQQLRMETLTRLGNAETLVQEHLESLMNRLTDQEQHAASILFEHLVTPGGTKIAYPALELTDSTGLEEKNLISLLEKLASGRQRIIRPVGPAPDRPTVQRYEIFHDVLASAILDWRKRYIWQQEQLEERKRRERQRRAMGLIGLAVAGTALSIGTFSWVEIGKRERDTLITEQQLESFEAMQQAELGAELDALQDVMQVAQTIKDDELEAAKPAATLALQTILSTIQEEHQFSALGNGVVSVNQAVLSPTGARVATASPDGSISIWTLDGTMQHQFQAQDARLSQLMFIADGEQLATVAIDGTVSIWDLEGQQVAQIQLPEEAGWVLGFSPDGTRLATATLDNTVIVWSLEGERLAEFPDAHEDLILSATFSPDGKLLATAGGSTVRLWDLATVQPLHTYRPEGLVFFTLFTPDSQSFVTAGQAGVVSTWSTESGEKERDFQTEQGAVYYLSSSPDGTQVATASADGSVNIWNEQGDRLAEFKGHENLVTGISFTPNHQVATITQSGTVRVWRVQEQRGFSADAADMLFRAQVQYAPDGQSLVTSSNNGITQWDLQAALQNQDGSTMSRSGTVLSSRFDAEGIPWFLSTTTNEAGRSGALMVQSFNADNPVVAVFYPPNQGTYWVAELSPDRGWLIAISFESGGMGLAQLRNVENPNESAISIPLQESVLPNSATFSPDSKRLAVATIDGSITIWSVADLAAGRTGSLQVLNLTDAGTYASALEFSSDGMHLAAALRNNTAQVWDGQGRLIATLQGHNNPVNRIHFSSDGNFLLTSSLDATARLWDLAGNQLAQYPSRSNSGVLDANFSPGGKEVATISMNGYVQFWPVETFEQLVDKGCNWLQNDGSVSSDGQRGVDQLSICNPQSALDSDVNRSSLTEAFGYLKHLAFSLTQPNE